jgi:transposase-like protein
MRSSAWGELTRELWRVWLYVRFTLSFRDVEDLLAERGLDVSYEALVQMRLWCKPGVRSISGGEPSER